MPPDRQAAEDDIAEQMPPQVSRRRHDPAHSERGAKLHSVTGVGRIGSDHFLKGDDVRADLGEHGRRARRHDAAIETPAAVDVVGRDPEIDVAGHPYLLSTMCCTDFSFSLQMNSMISLSRMMRWFTRTVNGAVYALGSSIVTSMTRVP